MPVRVGTVRTDATASTALISTTTAVRNSRIDAVKTTMTRYRTDRCERVPPVA